VTWKRLNDRAVEFEMSADTDGWVALGLSDDKFMVRQFVADFVTSFTFLYLSVFSPEY